MKNIHKFFGGGVERPKFFINLLAIIIMLCGFAVSLNVNAAASNLASLNEPAVGDYQVYSYTGNVQSFIAPANGVYQIEAYGSKGGTYRSNGDADLFTWMQTASGGYGGYASGHVILKKGERLYIVCGGLGASGGVWKGDYNSDGVYYAAVPTGNGYNGGGPQGGSDWSWGYAGGGGATHIAKVSGTLQSIGSSRLSDVYLVAGGGGGGYAGVDVNSKNQPKSIHNTPGSPGGSAVSGGTFGYGAASNGGGLYGNSTANSQAGGSSYVSDELSFVFGGVSYTTSMRAGANSSTGYARITYRAPLIAADFNKKTLYLTDGDMYTLQGTMSNALSYQIYLGDNVLFESTNAPGENKQEQTQEITYRSFVDEEGNGTFSLSFKMNEAFDGTRFMVKAKNPDGDEAQNTCTLGITKALVDSDKKVVTVGDTLVPIAFHVNNARSASVQVQEKTGKSSPVEGDYVAYVKPSNHSFTSGINATTPTGDVLITINSVLEDDYYKWYRVVLTNDGSGYISEPILLTHNIYNLHYSPKKETVGEPADVIYFNGVEVNGIYKDNELIYGFDAS